jgi:Tol biopolymer transport system component
MNQVASRLQLAATGAAGLCALTAVAAVAMPAFGDWSPRMDIQSLPSSSTELNSPSIDGCTSISPDGLTLAFNSFRSLNQEIWLATRPNTSVGFGDPVKLPAPVNTTAQEFCPVITRGGKLYFSSSRNGEPGDIYVSKLGPHGWSDPQRLGPNINTPGTVEEAPTFYEDDEGREVMLFSRRSPAAFTGAGGKIYQSVGGAPATLVAGGPNGVSSGGDNRPSVTHDGRTIFWDSFRTGSLGGPDIWYATRSNTSEPWGQAIQLSQLNSEANDTRPYVSWDGHTLIISAANDIWFSTRE